MKPMRFALGAMFLLIAAPATFGACGGDEPSADPKIRYCEQRCSCEKCSEEESGLCKDDILNLGDLAQSKDCNDLFDSYVTCVVNDAACSDGTYDDTVCSAEYKGVNDCITPPPPCKTVKDGVCNEPAPKGDDTCPEGSDTEDCMAPPTCATSGNGVCDEPGAPGSGLCAQGSDPVDCACAYTNDGYCDEPENGGPCYEGYDAEDCMPAMQCSTCAEYISNPDPAPLCTESVALWEDYDACVCQSSCVNECGANLCAKATPTSTCTSCVQTYCNTPFTACSNDI